MVVRGSREISLVPYWFKRSSLLLNAFPYQKCMGRKNIYILILLQPYSNNYLNPSVVLEWKCWWCALKNTTHTSTRTWTWMCFYLCNKAIRAQLAQEETKCVTQTESFLLFLLAQVIEISTEKSIMELSFSPFVYLWSLSDQWPKEVEPYSTVYRPKQWAE